jgi:hypothetical protein
MDFYKVKYLKYKQKYLQCKNVLAKCQKGGGGNFYNIFFCNYPYEKEIINEHIIKIKFMDRLYDVSFFPNVISFDTNGKKVLEIQIDNNGDDDDVIVSYFDDSLNLLKLIIKIFNFKYCQFNKKFFDHEDLYRYKSTKYYIFLNNEHPEYLQTKEFAMNFLSKREKFYNKMTLEKSKLNDRFFIIYGVNKYEILDDKINILLQLDTECILKFEIIDCISFLEIKEIKEFEGYEEFIDLILNIYNISTSISDEPISNKCIRFNNKYIYLNEAHELYATIKQISLDKTYNSELGISKDLLTEKLYSINFIWLRASSYTEKCFSINGDLDKFIDVNNISKILKLQQDEFFIKLINFSKNNYNSLVNFWIDMSQNQTKTIINLRVIFEVFNRYLGTHLCIRDVWSLRVANQMNIKYPDILPKCTGFSLILRVDLYKCIICVEELKRHTYSVFMDLDMKIIDQDIILSDNNIKILNRIGLVLTKLGITYENGFQIMGSEIKGIRDSVIETFNIMMIERTMIICNEFKKRGEQETKGIQQLVYHLYYSMYNFLYYKCGYGLYYFFDNLYTRLDETNMDIFIKKLNELAELYYTDTEFITGIYISYELINELTHFTNKMSILEIVSKLNEFNSESTITKYFESLRIYEGSPIKKVIVVQDDLSKMQTKSVDLIMFKDENTLPVSKHSWPFEMCKKYIKINGHTFEKK